MDSLLQALECDKEPAKDRYKALKFNSTGDVDYFTIQFTDISAKNRCDPSDGSATSEGGAQRLGSVL